MVDRGQKSRSGYRLRLKKYALLRTDILPGGEMAKTYSNNDENVIDSYKLFHLLRQTSDAVHKTREVELKKYKISPEQAGALVCIYSLGNKATPAELSRWLFRERNSVTILLNRMHRLGLINKKADTKRKNIIRLSLTKKGYEAYKHSVEFRSFFPIMDVLPESKRKKLWSLLQIIRLKIFDELHVDARAYSGIFDQPMLIDAVETDTDRKK
jgi:DNA-binding MarR family transcriptional regulator